MFNRVSVLLIAIVAATFAGNLAAQSASQEQNLATLLQLADYIGVDYPAAVADGAVVHEGEYAEMQEFSAKVITLTQQLPQSEGKTQLQSAGFALQNAIGAKVSSSEVAQLASEVARVTLTHYTITIAPRQVPDLAQGAKLFQESCASCHGETAHGDGIAGKALDPAPTNFYDLERHDLRSPFAMFNTITLGVAGTGMASFSVLSENDRWALAYYLSQIPYAQNEISAGKSHWQNNGNGKAALNSLDDLSRINATQIRNDAGETGVQMMAYLRAHPEVLRQDKNVALAAAHSNLNASLQAYQSANFSQATELALTAYLEGFELVEPALRNVDADLTTKIEAAMANVRAQIANRADAASVTASVDAASLLLNAAQAKLDEGGLSDAGSFVASFIIMAREGLEAILVLAAMIAFLRRAGRPEAIRWVHAGWIVALLMGAVTWFVSSQLISISGASREMTEGVSALLAAFILVFVGYWLHKNSSAQHFQKTINKMMLGALDNKKLWVLASLSFLAVYREAFETVLFYQALWAQGTHSPIVGGFVAGAVFLAVIAWVIFKLSVKLPLATFFKASAILIGALAVVFVGHGIAALQEAGKLPVQILPLPSLPILGVHNDALGLIAQGLMLITVLFLFTRENKPVAAANKA